MNSEAELPLTAIKVRLVILVHPEHRELCRRESSSLGDGCASFMHDEDGEALCGAYGEILNVTDNEEVSDEWHYRCHACLNAEVA